MKQIFVQEGTSSGAIMKKLEQALKMLHSLNAPKKRWVKGRYSTLPKSELMEYLEGSLLFLRSLDDPVEGDSEIEVSNIDMLKNVMKKYVGLI